MKKKISCVFVCLIWSTIASAQGFERFIPSIDHQSLIVSILVFGIGSLVCFLDFKNSTKKAIVFYSLTLVMMLLGLLATAVLPLIVIIDYTWVLLTSFAALPFLTFLFLHLRSMNKWRTILICILVPIIGFSGGTFFLLGHLSPHINNIVLWKQFGAYAVSFASFLLIRVVFKAVAEIFPLFSEE